MCTYMYMYTSIHTCLSIYIYIYIERERDRDIMFGGFGRMLKRPPPSGATGSCRGFLSWGPEVLVYFTCLVCLLKQQTTGRNRVGSIRFGSGVFENESVQFGSVLGDPPDSLEFCPLSAPWKEREREREIAAPVSRLPPWIHVYIYIYIERERERHICIYIYIYTHT